MSKGFKGMSNVDMKGRIRQVLLLIGAVILGIIISCSAQAQDFHKAKKRHFKAKYKTQINLSKHECAILDRKRNSIPKPTLVATKSKWKPKAEIDEPGFAMKPQ